MTVTTIPGRPPFADDPTKACHTRDPELWWPKERLTKGARGAEAKAVCRTCPLQRDCLNWALAFPEDWGVWGGHDERQRRDIRQTGRCRDTTCDLCPVTP